MFIGDPSLVLAAWSKERVPEPGPAAPAAEWCGPLSSMPQAGINPAHFHRSLIDLDGELVLAFQDASIPARGWPLEIKRFHHGGQEYSTELGSGWSWTYGVRLERDVSSQQPQVMEENGTISQYEQSGAGFYRLLVGMNGSALRQRRDGTWVRLRRDGRSEVFNRKGHLIQLLDTHGLALTIERKGGRPTRVVDAAGRALEFTFDGDKLTRVEDPIGRTTRYGYDNKGRLAWVRDTLDRETRFSYDRNRVHILQMVDGSVLRITYGERGKVKRLVGPGSLSTTFEHELAVDRTRWRMQTTNSLGHTERLSMERKGSTIELEIVDGSGILTEVRAGRSRIDVSRGGGPSATVELDENGHAKRVVDAGGEEVYLADNSSVTVGNELPADLSFDSRGYPIAMLLDGQDVFPTFDDAGRLVSIEDGLGLVTTYEYDAGDRLIKRVDPRGQVETFEYDPADRPTRQVDHRGNETTAAYDARGLIHRLQVPGQDAYVLEYDDAGRLARIAQGERYLVISLDPVGRPLALENERGNRCRYEYDGSGFLSAFVDWRGRRITLDPNAEGLPRTATNAIGTEFHLASAGMNGLDLKSSSGDSVSFGWSDSGVESVEGRTPMGRLWGSVSMPGGEPAIWMDPGLAHWSVERDDVGRAISWGHEGRSPARVFYDDSGLLGARHEPGGQEWEYQHDDIGRITVATSNRGARYTYDYDEFGDLVAVTSGRGHRVDYVYDKLGRLKEERNGKRVRLRRYKNGRLVEIEDVGLGKITLDYDPHGNLLRRVSVEGDVKRVTAHRYSRYDERLETTHPDGHVETFRYDDIGRLVQRVDGNLVEEWSYDDRGQLQNHTAGEYQETYTYDDDGRVESISGSRVVNNEYSLLDKPSSWTDGRGERWIVDHDSYGAPEHSYDPLGGLTIQSFSSAGELAWLLDPEGREHAQERDETGRLISTGPAVGARVGWRYDEHGGVSKVVRPGGLEINIERDQEGRELAWVAGETTLWRRVYDDHGRVTEIEDAIGRHVLVWDEGGRMRSRTDPFGRTITYDYDGLGRLQSMTGPDGEETLYNYDAYSRVQSITGIDGKQTELDRYPDGHLQRVRYPSGMRLEVGRGDDGRVDSLRYLDSGGEALVERRLKRDGQGSVTTSVDGDRNWSFEHDAIGRLLSESMPDAGEHRSAFDGSGNLILRSGLGEVSYDTGYRLTSIAGNQATHDSDGNLATVPLAASLDLVHDELGRVIEARRGDEEPVRYRYDYASRLIERRQGNEVVQLLHDGDQVLAAYDGEGNRIFWRDPFLGAVEATRVHRDSGTSLLAVDHLGTPVARLDGAGARRRETSAWGIPGAGWGNGFEPIGFTGAPHDTTTGLVFMGERAYLPELGRFTAPDPAGLGGGINPYAYAAGDPTLYRDRSGRQPDDQPKLPHDPHRPPGIPPDSISPIDSSTGTVAPVGSLTPHGSIAPVGSDTPAPNGTIAPVGSETSNGSIAPIGSRGRSIPGSGPIDVPNSVGSTNSGDENDFLPSWIRAAGRPGRFFPESDVNRSIETKKAIAARAHRIRLAANKAAQDARYWQERADRMTKQSRTQSFESMVAREHARRQNQKAAELHEQAEKLHRKAAEPLEQRAAEHEAKAASSRQKALKEARANEQRHRSAAEQHANTAKAHEAKAAQAHNAERYTEEQASRKAASKARRQQARAQKLADTARNRAASIEAGRTPKGKLGKLSNREAAMAADARRQASQPPKKAIEAQRQARAHTETASMMEARARLASERAAKSDSAARQLANDAQAERVLAEHRRTAAKAELTSTSGLRPGEIPRTEGKINRLARWADTKLTQSETSIRNRLAPIRPLTWIGRHQQRLVNWQHKNWRLKRLSRGFNNVFNQGPKTRLAGRALGILGIGLLVMDTVNVITDPDMTVEDKILHVGWNAFLVVLPFLGPLGVVASLGIAAWSLGSMLGSWLANIVNGDPTFITTPDTLGELGTARADGTRIRLATGPDSPASISAYLGERALLRGAVFDAQGKRVRSLDTSVPNAGMARLSWDGTNDAGEDVAEGDDYELWIEGAWQDGELLDLPPSMVRVVVDRTPPSIRLTDARVEQDRIRVSASSSEPTTVHWSVRQRPGAWRSLGDETQLGDSHKIDVSRGQFGAGAFQLRAVGRDEAGHRVEAIVPLTLPAPAAGRLVAGVEVEQNLQLVAVDRGWAEADLHHWLEGELPADSEAIGQWRWSEEKDPRGVRTHQSTGLGPDLHYVIAPQEGWFLGEGDNLVQYVLLDPTDAPEQIALQVYADGLDGAHRISWGGLLLDLDPGGGGGFTSMGVLPAAGRWQRLRIPATALNLVGRRVEGILFATHGGIALWGTTTTSSATDVSPAVTDADATRREAESQTELRLRFDVLSAGPLAIDLVGGDGTNHPLFQGTVGAGRRLLTWTGPTLAVAGGRLRFVRGADQQEVKIAAPASGELLARIEYPPSGAVVRETIPIFGDAGGRTFERAVVDFRPLDGDDKSWVELTRSSSPSVISRATILATIEASMAGALRRTIYGNLASFHTGSFSHRFEFRPTTEKPISSGRVLVRLRVFGTDGAVASDQVELIIGEVVSNAYACTVPSPDQRARLQLTALSLPTPMATLGVDPVALPPLPDGWRAVGGAYTLAPEAYQLVHPGRLELSLGETTEVPAGAQLYRHNRGRGWARVPAVVAPDGWLAGKVRAFGRDCAWAILAPSSAPAPRPRSPRPAPVGERTVLVGTSSAPAVDLLALQTTEKGGTKTYRVRSDEEGRFRFEGIELELGVNHFDVTELGFEGVPGEASRVSVIPSLPSRDQLARAEDAVDTDQLEPSGPPAPLPWPDGAPPPELQTAFDELGENGGAWRSLPVLPRSGRTPVLIGESFPVTRQTVLGFSYRFEPGTDVQLVVRGAGAAYLVPLAGRPPAQIEGVRILPSSSLVADGQWHVAVVPLGALLGTRLSRIDQIAVGQVQQVGWRLFGLQAAINEVLIDTLWLGDRWDAAGVNKVRLNYGDNVNIQTIAVGVDSDPTGEPTEELPGMTQVLDLPPQQEELEYIHLRSRGSAGHWGETLHWPRVADRTAPEMLDPSPAPGSESGTLRMAVTLRDAGSGVDRESVRLEVAGVAVPKEALQFDDATGRVSFALGDVPDRPSVAPGQTLEIVVTHASDRAGNTLVEPFTWSFTFSRTGLSAGSARLLTLEGGRDGAFSPDGARVVFAAERLGRVDLHVLDLNTGAERPLTADFAVERSPSWSLDGTRMVYRADDQLMLMNVADATSVAVDLDISDPAWIDDDTLLGVRGGQLYSCVLSSATCTPILDAATAGTLRRPRRSPSGTLAFGHSLYHESVWVVEHGTRRALSLELRDPALRQQDPFPSDDGEWIVYADGGREPGLWMTRAGGSSRQRLIVSDAGTIRRPSFSPAGDRVLFDSDRNGVRNLWLLDLANSPEVEMNPLSLGLDQSQPLPIKISLAAETEVRVTVAGAQGVELAELLPRGLQPAGRQTLSWSPPADGGATVDAAGSELTLMVTTFSLGREFVSRHPIHLDTMPPRTRVYRSSDDREIGPMVLPGSEEAIELRADDGPTGTGVLRTEFLLQDGEGWRPAPAVIRMADVIGGVLSYRSHDRLGRVEAQRSINLSNGVELTPEEAVATVAAVAVDGQAREEEEARLPELGNEDLDAAGSMRVWGILAGVALVILLLVVVRRRRKGGSNEA